MTTNAAKQKDITQKTAKTSANMDELMQEIADWHCWACKMAKFPCGSGAETRLSQSDNARHITILLMRLIALWIMLRMGLLPACIFSPSYLEKILMRFNPNSIESGEYYNAILQNLFFAVLCRKADERSFTNGMNPSLEYGINTMLRDDKRKTFFKIRYQEVLGIFRNVPYIKCSLFECKDSFENKAANIKEYSDGFSRESGRRAFIPNALFFKKSKDRHIGIINILEKCFLPLDEKNASTDIIEDKIKIILSGIQKSGIMPKRQKEELLTLIRILNSEMKGNNVIIALKTNEDEKKPSGGKEILAYNKAARFKAELSSIKDKMHSTKLSCHARELRIRGSQILYEMKQAGLYGFLAENR